MTNYLLYFSPGLVQEKGLLISTEIFHLLLECHRPGSQPPHVYSFLHQQNEESSQKDRRKGHVHKLTLSFHKMFRNQYHITLDVENKLF